MLAVEVQLSSVTDAEVLARREAYLRLGITVAWVWHGNPPHVLYLFHEPGWVYDLAQDQIGLVYGKPHPTRLGGDPDGGRLGPHWPPCPGDATSTRWMPIADLRLTGEGLQASEQVLARLTREAMETARQACMRPQPSSTPVVRERRTEPRVPVPRNQVRPPVNARLGLDPGKTGGREGDRSRALVQARARVFLTQRIRKTEARIAELQKRDTGSAAGAEGPHGTAVDQPSQGVLGQIDGLANQLRILRMQVALLPEQPAQ